MISHCSSNFEPSYLKKTQVWLLTALYSLDLESRKWFLRKYFFSFMEKVSREDVITHCLKEECFQKNNASVCPAWMLLLGFKLALCDRFSVYLTSFNIPVFYSFSFRKMNCLKWSKANFEGKKKGKIALRGYQANLISDPNTQAYFLIEMKSARECQVQLSFCFH